MPRVTYFTYRI